MTNGRGVKAGNCDEKDATSGGVVTLHTPILKTPAAGPSARVRPRVTDGGSSKAGNQSEEEEEASIIEACVIEDGVATDNDPKGSGLGLNFSAEPDMAECECGRRPTELKIEQPRPIRTRVKLSRLEMEAYEPLHMVGAGECKEAERAQ